MVQVDWLHRIENRAGLEDSRQYFVLMAEISLKSLILVTWVSSEVSKTCEWRRERYANTYDRWEA